MFTDQQILNIKIEGKEYTAIAFDNKKTELPTFLLQGEKKASYLYENEELKPWYWNGFTYHENLNCVYFEKLNIHPLYQLSTTLRNKAPKLINNLAKALSLCSKDFLDLRGGIIGAWRIYFTDNDGVLLLSSTLADIFASTNDEQTRYANNASFIHANIHQPFTLIDQMAQLYYFSILGIKPFESSQVREVGYKPIPISLASQVLQFKPESEIIDKIDKLLTLKLGAQRDIAGNLTPQEALKWFYTKFEDTTWDLPNLTEPLNIFKELEKTESGRKYLSSLGKKADKSIFLRKRGMLIIIITAAVLMVGSFTYSRIKESLKPPYTAEMNQYEIINSYYNAQNNLDLEKLEDSLAKGVKSPISTEVTTLFVTRQTRKAYENKDTVINPGMWEKSGRQPIDDGSIIYGIDNVEIENLGNDLYKASSILYTPYDYVDDEQPAEVGYTYCYRFDQVQVFKIQESPKGWLEITDLQSISTTYKDTLKIPTVSPYSTTQNTDSVDNRKTESIYDKDLASKLK